MCKTFWLEIADENCEVENEEEDPEISLHAIIGIWTPQTMQVSVVVRGLQVEVLIDLGNTHSFIADRIVRQAKLEPDDRGHVRVLIANGERLQSPGVCRAVRLQVGAELLLVDLFLLHLGGFDMVLGVNWLGTLGPIVWDLTHLMMAFWNQGRKIALQG